VHLDSAAAVIDYFSAAESDSSRAGFAWVHVADDPAVMEMLDPLKVTVRCIPMEGNDAPGACIVTGKPVSGRSVLARAY
jgi:prolyl-tRNA synthetase